MIRINLLEQNAKSKGGRAARAAAASGGGGARGGGGSLLVTVSLVGMLALNGVLGYQAWRGINKAAVEFREVAAKRDKLKTDIEKQLTEAEQIRQYREVVANQMDVLQSLDPQDRILWCEKMNMLANLIPQDVFVGEIKITEDVQMVETKQSIEARKKWNDTPPAKRVEKEPKPVTKPLIKYHMNILGRSQGKDSIEQFKNMMKFHDAMIAHEQADPAGAAHRFMDGFNPIIDFKGGIASVYEGLPVHEFTFELTTRAMGGDEPTAETAGQPEGRKVAQR